MLPTWPGCAEAPAQLQEPVQGDPERVELRRAGSQGTWVLAATNLLCDHGQVACHLWGLALSIVERRGGFWGLVRSPGDLCLCKEPDSHRLGQPALT